jgi:hypothetical protein
MGETDKTMIDAFIATFGDALKVSPEKRYEYRKANRDAILDDQGSVSGTDGKHVILPPVIPPWEKK